MKKINSTFLMTMFVMIFFVGCGCNNEELSKIIIDNNDKNYLKGSSENISFIDQDENNIIANLETVNYYTEQHEIGRDACEYNTYEYGNRVFKMGNYSGKISLEYNSNLSIQVNNNVDYNNLVLKNPQEVNFDNLLNDIELSGFTFNNVLVLEKVSEGGSINKIVYSKTNGIEFILFEDGTWYKRVE